MSQPKSIAVERFEEQQDSESPSNTESERDENSADVPQTAKLDNDQSGSSDEEPPAGENLSEEIYEVEKIVDRRDTGEGLFYLVRWKGFGEADDTWEPAENLSHATKAICEYETSRKEMKAAPKTPKLNSRKESVKRQTAPKSVSKRGRPREASSDISDLESKNSDRYKDNDSDYEKSSKFKKSTLPASYRKRAMTKAALKSHSPSTVKSLESMCFKPHSEATSAANELRQSWLYESDSKNDSGSDREHEKRLEQRRLIPRERKTVEEQDRRRLIQKRELVEKVGNTTSSSKRRRQEKTSNSDKRENLMEENRGGFLSGTRPVPLSEKTSDNDAAQQQIFSIRKHRDGRIMVLMGTDAAKRVVSLRDAHNIDSWGLLQHILQYAVFE